MGQGCVDDASMSWGVYLLPSMGVFSSVGLSIRTYSSLMGIARGLFLELEILYRGHCRLWIPPLGGFTKERSGVRS